MQIGLPVSYSLWVSFLEIKCSVGNDAKFRIHLPVPLFFDFRNLRYLQYVAHIASLVTKGHRVSQQ